MRRTKELIAKARVEIHHNMECWFLFHGSISLMLRYAYTACLLTKTRGGGGVCCAVLTEYSNTSQVCLSNCRPCGWSPASHRGGWGFDPRSVHIKVYGGQSCTGTDFLWVLRSFAVSVFPATIHTHTHLIIAFIRKIIWQILRFSQPTNAISDIGSSPDQVLSLFAFQALPARSNIGGRRFCTACTELLALISVQSDVTWFWDWALSGAHNGTCIAGSVVELQVVLVSASGDRTDGRTNGLLMWKRVTVQTGWLCDGQWAERRAELCTPRTKHLHVHCSSI